MRAPTNPVLVNCVGTGVLDRPLIQRNLRTVREAGPYNDNLKFARQTRICNVKTERVIRSVLGVIRN